MDNLPKLALKRAGEFIRSIGTDQGLQERKRATWIRHNDLEIPLPDPLQILVEGHEKVKTSRTWTIHHEDTFKKLVSPLQSLTN